jgi:anaerobic magnesium-protoporphyrin IX monomethyl ester cyclase
MAFRLLLVEPPKKYWFVMGDYLPPPTALLVLAAYVERELPEVELEVLDCQGAGVGWEGIEGTIRSFRPHMVLASGYTCNAYVCARVVEIAKTVDPDILTVLGGQHFSFTPEESLETYPEIDVIVRGEGEQTLVELVRTVMGKQTLTSVRGIAFRHEGKVVMTPDRPLIEDLDTLPYPAYHLVEDYIRSYHFTMMAGRNTVYMVLEGGRGCDHTCAFCTQWKHWGGRWRTKSPQRIADEIEHVNETFGGTFLWLTDDNFEYSRRGPMLYEELKDRRCHEDVMLFWQVRTDDVANNPDLVGKMREVGNYWVLIGVESNSRENLEEYRKGASVSDSERALRVLKDNDVFTQAMYVVGSRRDTAESIERLRVWSRSLEAKLSIFTVLTPFPGTSYFKKALREGWIENSNYADYDMVHAIMPTETLSRSQVQAELYQCYRSAYGSLGQNIRGFFSRNKLERTMYRHMAGQSVLRRLRELI